MKRLTWPGQNRKAWRAWALIPACVLGLASSGFTGCQPDDPLAAPGKVPANATAPSVVDQAAAQQKAAQDAEAARQAAAAAQHAQQVQNLITRAQASYNSGVTNYNNNRLDAARQDFDYAVDTMLSSGMDLKNDPVLSDEFDRLLSAINSLEIVALKQGNGFSPKIEAAPIDEASEVTFAPDPVLVGKVTAELKTTKSDFPLVVNDYVAGWINYFSSPRGRGKLKWSLERAGKYKDMIERVLAENGVPQDLIYQAVAESGFQPQALNARSGAGGMWQFMPYGNYGLERNGYFDERFDPEKSTQAYARYIKALYNQFGDWYLAMAAYDWGPGNVQRVVSRTGYADFWELYKRNVMPAETKQYVPGIIAAIIMAKNPAQYGLTDINPDPPVLSDKVSTTYSIDMRLVADVTGSSVQEIVALNPSLLRLVTPADRSYDLHLPPGTKDLYLERIKDIPEERRASWRYHIVKPSETLADIATSFHVKPTELASLNEVSAAQPLEEGDELIVPVAASSSAGLGQTRYTTRSGDTLVTLADRFNVTVDDLRRWNHLTSNTVPAGRSLSVAEPVHLAPTRAARKGRATSHGKSSSSSRSRSTATSSKKTAAKKPRKK